MELRRVSEINRKYRKIKENMLKSYTKYFLWKCRIPVCFKAPTRTLEVKEL